MTGAVTTGSGNPIHQTELPDVLIVRPRRHGDARGWFSETFRMSWFESASAPTFVQDNHSFTALPSTVRGLHFQAPPHAQAKLVRVSRGAVFDVVVDIRVGSPTYGRHVSAILSADGWEQLFVPVGFAHGFCTIEPDTEVLYKASDYYAPDHDRGLRSSKAAPTEDTPAATTWGSWRPSMVVPRPSGFSTPMRCLAAGLCLG